MAVRSVCRADSDPSPADLLEQRPAKSANTQLVMELRRSLEQYEARYNLPSERLHAALEAGDLTETLDVCDWLIQYNLLLRVQGR